jgi:hypothetical protein
MWNEQPNNSKRRIFRWLECFHLDKSLHSTYVTVCDEQHGLRRGAVNLEHADVDKECLDVSIWQTSTHSAEESLTVRASEMPFDTEANPSHVVHVPTNDVEPSLEVRHLDCVLEGAKPTARD